MFSFSHKRRGSFIDQILPTSFNSSNPGFLVVKFGISFFRHFFCHISTKALLACCNWWRKLENHCLTPSHWQLSHTSKMVRDSEQSKCSSKTTLLLGKSLLKFVALSFVCLCELGGHVHIRSAKH